MVGVLAGVGAGVGAELAGDHMAGDHMAPCFLVGIFLGLLLAFVNTLFFGQFDTLLGPIVPILVVQGTLVAILVVPVFQLLDLIITELKKHMTSYNSMPLIG